jgi:hypothetical protein
MPYNHKPTYKQLLGHMEHHDVRKWLLDAADADEAGTIHNAIARSSPHRVARKLAEAFYYKERRHGR